MKEIWARLTDNEGNYIETPKAYRVFCAYLKLKEGRSLKKLEEYLERNRRDITKLHQLALYSSRNNWVERAEAYDNHVLKDAHTSIAKKYVQDIVTNYDNNNFVRNAINNTVKALLEDEHTKPHLKLKGLNDAANGLSNIENQQRNMGNIDEVLKNTNLDISMVADVINTNFEGKEKSVFDKLKAVDESLEEKDSN